MDYISLNTAYTATNSSMSGLVPAGAGANGIPLPWDPQGNTPDPSQFQINWNLTGQALINDIESKYEALTQYLQQNPGCYNGYLLLLQNTLDIGSHMSSLSPADQQTLTSFMNTQLSSNAGNVTLMQLMIDMALKGTAVQSGIPAALALAQTLVNQLQAMTGFGATFNTMYLEAYQMNSGGLNDWIAKHQVTFTDPLTGQQKTTWVDDDGNPMNFEEFAGLAAFQIGSFFLNQTDSQGYIDSIYQTQIQQMEASCKDPWLLLMMLMSLLNQRDQDNGRTVNGTANNIQTLTDGNTNSVQGMLNDLNNMTPSNIQDFYAKFNDLRNLIELDPNLASLAPNLEQVFGLVNGMQVSIPPLSPNNPGYLTWNVGPGIYNLPLNTPVTYVINGAMTKLTWNGTTITSQPLGGNGNVTTVPSTNGSLYLSGGSMTIFNTGSTPLSVSFGQLAAMGDYGDIATTLQNSAGTTTMSNMVNTVTSLQTYLNSPAQAMQQQLQQETQYSQTIESFMQTCFKNIQTQEQMISQNTSAGG